MKPFESIPLISPSILVIFTLLLFLGLMTGPGFSADSDVTFSPDTYVLLNSNLSQGLEFYTLDNGLRVVLAPQKDLHTVTVRRSVQVGARDEQPGESGYAHLFEHMMFKGTPKVEDGMYFRVIEQAGGTANAFTSFDVTSYQATPKKVKRFYGQYYHPANIVLTLYGNFDPDQARKGKWDYT